MNSVPHDNWLLRSVLRLMLPIARFCLKHSISYQEFSSTCKRAFLNAAKEQLERTNTQLNVSRLSVLTGLHRADVKKLLDSGKQGFEEAYQNVPARIALHWSQDKRFCTKQGIPRVLRYSENKGEFHDLVLSVNRNYSVRTILDGMLQAGLVEKTQSGLKLLKTEISTQSDKEIVKLLVDDVTSLFQVVEENSTSPDTPNLHVRTLFDNLFIDDLPELREWIRMKGREFQKEVREKLAEHDKDFDVDRDQSDRAGGGMSVTVFSTWSISEN